MALKRCRSQEIGMTEDMTLPDGMWPEKMNGAWPNEGVANYYASIATFEGGAADRQYLFKALNDQAQAYYTTRYGRGFVYLCQIQGLIQQATKGAKGVDDIARALYKRQLKHGEQNSDEFHELVGEIIGAEETDKVRTAMEGGKVIVSYDDCFAKYGLELTKKITELAQGSRAGQAGIRNGDAIVRAWMLWVVLEWFERVDFCQHPPSRPVFSVGLSLPLEPSLVLECPEIPMMANLSVKVGWLAKYDCNMAEGARPFALGVYLAYRNCSAWRILTYLPPDDEAMAPDLSDIMKVESLGAQLYGASVSHSSGDNRKARELMRRIDRIDPSDSYSQTYRMVANGE
ncbi:hypothetical protein SUNI508_11935 [Seiridium unicorne]|uniref:Uncharacterized protein n=1 Tax=Seiridium unicorne TaxID=138068 RepID=A0ABR2UFW4_9PEZI